MTNKKNTLVKDSLQKQLNTSVMEMQGATGVEDGQPIGNCDEAMTLCSVLEAIFLHGLKDSLLNRVTEALSGPDFDAMPQPSFWGPLLVFSHRQIIDQIQSMRQITTEVGYCRAWIRLALNEGLLSSYLCSIRRDNSALKPYYDRAAFIRDADLVDVAQRLIESLDNVNFELACNSSLLNYWSSTPLLMSAIWSPPMKSCPVFSAVDIAKTINSEASNSDNYDDVETASSIGSLSSFNSSQSMLNNVASFTEDEALKIILKQDRNNSSQVSRPLSGSTGSSALLKKVYRDKRRQAEAERRLEQACSSNGMTESGADSQPEESSSGIVSTKNSEQEPPDARSPAVDTFAKNETTSEEAAVVDRNGLSSEQPENTIENESANAETGPGTIGNSLIGRPGWSTSFEDGESSMNTSIISRGSGVDAPRTPGEGTTYDALIKSYHTAGYTTSPDLQEFLDKYAEDEPARREPKPRPEVKVINRIVKRKFIILLLFVR